MLKVVSIIVAACACVALSPVAEAHHGHKHHTASKIHYGGKPGLGYWRRGPETGYGFGFSSYKGDPFGRDDYFDRDKCYYVHHHDYCLKNRIFDGFR